MPADADYYFLRITQPDGDLAVTAPIWVDAEEELGITDFTPEELMHYVFDSVRERELVFVYKTVYDGPITPSDETDGGRFWSMEEIKESIGKGILTPNFETEIQKVVEELKIKS